MIWETFHKKFQAVSFIHSKISGLHYMPITELDTLEYVTSHISQGQYFTTWLCLVQY